MAREDARRKELYAALQPKQTRVVYMEKDPETGLIGNFELHVIGLNTQATKYGTNEESILGSKRATYCALSYVWGDTNQDTSIPIKGPPDGRMYEVRITASAIRALQQSSSHWGSGTRMVMWIDQICINQQSNEEKSSQVAMMKQIYELASLVFVWLGDPTEDSDLAFKYISETGKKIRESWNLDKADVYVPGDPDDALASNPPVWANESVHSQQGALVISGLPEEQSRGILVAKSAGEFARSHEGTLRQAQGLYETVAEHGSDAWQAIVRLLTRPWFQRAWIRQEVTALRGYATLVFSGSGAASWQDIELFQSLAQSIEVESLPSELACIAQLRVRKNTNSILAFARGRRLGASLMRMLDDLRCAEATDARDKLYCCLGFGSDEPGRKCQLLPDYSVGTSQAFTNFVCWYMCEHQNLDFLGYAGSIKGDFQFPSWVPRWDYIPHLATPTPFAKSKSIDYMLVPHLYSASGVYVNDIHVKLPLPPSKEFEALGLPGVYLCSVSTVLDGVFSRLNTKIESSWFEKISHGANGVYSCEVLARTIVADAEPKERNNMMQYVRRARWDPNSEVNWLNEMNLKTVTLGRCVFMIEDEEGELLLLGIGPASMASGDKLYLFKGAKVLHILREAECKKAQSVSVLNCNGEDHELVYFRPGDLCHVFVGECFVLGLMDGEILDMLGPSNHHRRPLALQNMSEDFEKVYVL